MASNISYVAMATVHGEHACWLTSPRLAGHRTFAARQFAELFESESQAADAILRMMCLENCRGIDFTIETAEEAARVPSF
jgi:hypothetical protein